MALFAIDPRSHFPWGLEAIPHNPDEVPKILSAYLGACMETYNEDLAIAYFMPEVNKDDFGPMAHALKEYFARVHGVHLLEVLPCPIGDAYVRVLNPVEREHFLNESYQFNSQDTLSFAKHDEGRNARLQTMNREAWIMLMAYPEDAKNNTAVAKAVGGFSLLRYWHDSVNKARVVVKVNLKDDSEIPHGVIVSAGLPPRTTSWTCPVFVLKYKDVVVQSDEDPIPSNGPLFSPTLLCSSMDRDKFCSSR
ncbi:hypothetical protein HU200_065348 [Digitaria exilis]|uniref:DUF7597 domain-containing protein n=1 Tax=Digitaria exilis TaxID=1010633 RepID=A0A835A068_9POAL|nr:hypothetical protein HU200_065348 [Digitaria exilis]